MRGDNEKVAKSMAGQGIDGDMDTINEGGNIVGASVDGSSSWQIR